MSPEHVVTASRTLAGLTPLDAALPSLPAMISTDSHVMEPDALWQQLPARLRENLPAVQFGGARPAGAADPVARVADQEVDGVCAEIIFPNYGMVLFGLDDIETQRAAMGLYNSWLADFCRAAPTRLFGVPCISVYDIDAAVDEMHRALDLGLIGIMVWQVPDPHLPFSSDHYERLWAAAAEVGAPVHTHILTGHSYAKGGLGKTLGAERIRDAVNRKQTDTVNALFDMIFSGAFERHPKLRLVLAESEVGWIPYVLQQWDYYFERFRATQSMPISRRPSEIFAEHVFCTFLEDFAGTRQFTWWGHDNCMWSNDYPHFNMTFPNSRENVQKHLRGLPYDLQVKLVRDNAVRLYGLPLERGL
jgi:predicted TIM-barrel fold metal-dependent hydrolase